MRLNEVTQGKLEAFEVALLEKAEAAKSASQYNRAVIEAAMESKVAEIDSKDVSLEKPWQIIAWSRDVLSHIDAAKRPPSQGE